VKNRQVEGKKFLDREKTGVNTVLKRADKRWGLTRLPPMWGYREKIDGPKKMRNLGPGAYQRILPTRGGGREKIRQGKAQVRDRTGFCAKKKKGVKAAKGKRVSKKVLFPGGTCTQDPHPGGPFTKGERRGRHTPHRGKWSGNWKGKELTLWQEKELTRTA